MTEYIPPRSRHRLQVRFEEALVRLQGGPRSYSELEDVA
jgi:hypothetical protein